MQDSRAVQKPLSMRHFLCVVVLFALTVLARAQAPEVDSPAAAPTATRTATLQALVTTNNIQTTVVFEYGLTAAYGSTIQATATASATASIVKVETVALIGGETYHFRVTVTNPDGTDTTGDVTFVMPASAPTLTPPAPTATRTPGQDEITFRGTITANGTAGSAYFEWGAAVNNQPPATYTVQTPATVVAANAKAFPVTAVIDDTDGLQRGVNYYFRFVFSDGTTTTTTDSIAFTLANGTPVAGPDTFVLQTTSTTKLNVLANDSDPDGDTLEIIDVTEPENGTATITGTQITYQPGPGFSGSDSFSYTIDDGNGGEATAQVTITSPQGVVNGFHGGFVKTLEGKEAGYVLINGTQRGSFTAEVRLDGSDFRLSGRLAGDGSYRGKMWGSGEQHTVEFKVQQGTGAATLRILIDGGRWIAEVPTGLLSQEQLISLSGRYTVLLPGTGSTGGNGDDEENEGDTTPAGTGWTIIKVRPDGTASLKGKLPDGRTFSSKGVVGAGEESGVALTFFDDPKKTVVVGTLTLSEDEVSGSVRVEREKSGEEFFPKGYDTTLTASGARYIKPEKGQRALETGAPENDLQTITFSGGNLASEFSRELRVSEKDKVEVLEPGDDKMSMKIDRNTGRFTVKFRLTGRMNRKATGVLIQDRGDSGSGSGAGVFLGLTESGKVELSITSSSDDEPDDSNEENTNENENEEEEIE